MTDANDEALAKAATERLAALAPDATVAVDDAGRMVTVTFAAMPSQEAEDAAHEVAGHLGLGVQLLVRRGTSLARWRGNRALTGAG